MSGNRDLGDWLAPFELPEDKLCQLTARLADSYKRLALESEDQFLATPVTKLPTGEEQGEYLAIDLGGSNLRVAFVNLLGVQRAPGRRFSIKQYDERIEKYGQKSWPIAESLKDEKAEDLFAWIGDCLAEVIAEHYGDVQQENMPTEIPLGITFSFPMMQESLSEATLLPMGKGFSITSNPNLGSLVMHGYERHLRSDGPRGRALPPIKLCAIANDSATTLISLSYTTAANLNSKAVIGLILGTGCNAAVPMKPSALAKSKVDYATRGEPVDEIVVNTEWTIRGVADALNGCNLPTRWDRKLDEALPHPGFQPFEYLTAGSYLGEIVRLSMYDHFTSQLGLKDSDLPKNITKRNGLSNTWMCHNVVVTDSAEVLSETLNTSPEFGEGSPEFWTPDLARVFLRTERAVLRRSAGLIAAAIVGLLVSSGELTLVEQSLSNGSASSSDPTTSISDNDDRRAAASASAPVINGQGRELVVAYCGGLICLYKGYVQRVREDLAFLVKTIVAEKDTSIVLREASEGGVIGAGVLAGTVWKQD